MKKNSANPKGGATQGKHSVEPVAVRLLSAIAKLDRNLFG
jgi:hypothetical protein